MAETNRLEWRLDASTVRSIRILWAFGVGTFFAMIVLIIFWRFLSLTGEVGGQSIVIAAIAALVVTILAFVIGRGAERRIERFSAILPVDVTPPSGRGLDRLVDAILGTLVMSVIIGSLMGIGRIAAGSDVVGFGAGPFTGMAALLLPIALVALLLSSFLQSVGILDVDDETVTLSDPDATIDLDTIAGMTSREIGDAAIVSLTYTQPDGQYVPGPRRIVVPLDIANELEALVS